MATMLALMLVTVFGGAFVLFLIFVSLGLFLWVLVMSACIAVFAGLHYLAWGRTTRMDDGPKDDSELDAAADRRLRDLLDRRKRRDT
jgi:hypothetical protein